MAKLGTLMLTLALAGALLAIGAPAASAAPAPSCTSDACGDAVGVSCRLTGVLDGDPSATLGCVPHDIGE